MTRKRFVKLLMAYGYTRNRANELAQKCHQNGVPYVEDIHRRKVHLCFNGKKFARAIRQATQEVERAMQQLNEAVKRMGKSFKIPKPDMVVHHPQLITTTNAYNFLEKNMQIMPLADHKAMHNGLRVDFPAIDEMSAQWPKQNPHINGGGGNE